jgi:hypothetical protein
MNRYGRCGTVSARNIPVAPHRTRRIVQQGIEEPDGVVVEESIEQADRRLSRNILVRAVLDRPIGASWI